MWMSEAHHQQSLCHLGMCDHYFCNFIKTKVENWACVVVSAVHIVWVFFVKKEIVWKLISQKLMIKFE